MKCIVNGHKDNKNQTRVKYAEEGTDNKERKETLMKYAMTQHNRLDKKRWENMAKGITEEEQKWRYIYTHTLRGQARGEVKEKKKYGKNEQQEKKRSVGDLYCDKRVRQV